MIICIAGDTTDLSSVYLGWAARRAGHRVVLLDEEKLGDDWSFAFEDGLDGGVVEHAGTRIPFSELAGVSARFDPEPAIPSGLDLDPLSVERFRAERRAGLHQLRERVPCPVANRPSAGRANGSKPLQMAMLERAGFRVPRWIVSNDAARARAFLAELDGPAVYKRGVRPAVTRPHLRCLGGVPTGERDEPRRDPGLHPRPRRACPRDRRGVPRDRGQRHRRRLPVRRLAGVPALRRPTRSPRSAAAWRPAKASSSRDLTSASTPPTNGTASRSTRCRASSRISGRQASPSPRSCSAHSRPTPAGPRTQSTHDAGARDTRTTSGRPPHRPGSNALALGRRTSAPRSPTTRSCSSPTGAPPAARPGLVLRLRGPHSRLPGVGAEAGVDRDVEAGLAPRRGGHAADRERARPGASASRRPPHVNWQPPASTSENLGGRRAGTRIPRTHWRRLLDRQLAAQSAHPQAVGSRCTRVCAHARYH